MPTDERAQPRNCASCEERAVGHRCKICKTWLYCSKECAKRDSKVHKKACSRLALAVTANKAECLSTEDSWLFLKHVHYLLERSSGAQEDRTKEQKSRRLVLNGTAPAAKRDARGSIASLRASVARASPHSTASVGEVETTFKENMTHGTEGCRHYASERNSKTRTTRETPDLRTDYPAMALQQAFPSLKRSEKFLVIGCGESLLSERMCQDGFLDVLSVDASASATAKLSRRAPRFENTDARCRYEVMDPCSLPLDTGLFSGVVAEGTVDTTLAGLEGSEKARNLCAEAMRVLRPGGTFLVISKSTGDEMLHKLVAMCGRGSVCDRPTTLNPDQIGDDTCAYAYMVRKCLLTTDAEGVGRPAHAAATDFDLPRRESEDGTSEDAERARTAHANGTMKSAKAAASIAIGNKHVTSEEDHKTVVSDSTATALRRESIRKDLVDRGQMESLLESYRVSSFRAPDGWSRDPPSEQVCEERDRPFFDKLNAARGDALTDRVVEEVAAAYREMKDGEDRAFTNLERDILEGREKDISKAVKALEEDEAIKRRQFSKRIHEIARGGDPLGQLMASSQIGEGKNVETTSSTDADHRPTSLPWGLRDSFSEDNESSCYELASRGELKASELDIKIDAHRLRVIHKRGVNRDTWLDRELRDSVNVTESTWHIEDKNNLFINLVKRRRRKWGGMFREEENPTPSGLSLAKHIAFRSAQSSSPSASTGRSPDVQPEVQTQVQPESAGSGPLLSDVLADQMFEPPERFLLEDQTGIRVLQMYMSKPLGYTVKVFEILRVDSEACDLLVLLCDGTGGNDMFLGQRVDLGRKDFAITEATVQDNAAAGVCVFRLPYHDVSDSVAADGMCISEEGAESGDADAEGATLVRDLRCRFCSHLFISAGKSLAVRAMPSGRWDDCIEDMICFDGPSAVSMLARDVNFARAGRCLMGRDEVLLHSRDLLPGAVVVAAADHAFVPNPPSVTGMGLADQGQGEKEWRSVECARCEVAIGRVTLLSNADGSQGYGVLLLKHLLVGKDAHGGTDVRHANGNEEPHATGSTCGANDREEQRRDRFPEPRSVFASRTAAKWLMGELQHAQETDGCSRFILTAKGRSPAAPAGCLRLHVLAIANWVSVRGHRKRRRAYRIGFREESLREAQEALKSDATKRREATRHHEPLKESAMPRAAPVLEVSYEEYRTIRRGLLDAAWTSDWSGSTFLAKANGRDLCYSFLF